MANGKYWRDDPFYFTAINLDRDVPEHDPDEDEDEEYEEDLDEEYEDEDDDWEDLEDDAHVGGSHRSSSGNDDWSGYYEDLD
jgi:hypothetical protein